MRKAINRRVNPYTLAPMTMLRILVQSTSYAKAQNPLTPMPQSISLSGKRFSGCIVAAVY